MEDIKQAQYEMRSLYLDGATGILTSAIMWLVAAIVAHTFSSKLGVWTLLIGGALIYPVTMLVNRILGFAEAHSKKNPLGNLAMEGTFFMLMCIPIAYGLTLFRIEWFFQGMLLIIGGRYFTFNTIYGNRLYWLLGAALAISAYLLLVLRATAPVSALTGAIIEFSFGLFMLLNFYRKKRLGTI